MPKIVVRTSYLSAININSFFLGLKKLAGICFFASLIACQSAPLPIEEQVIARSALDAARAVDAARYSSGHWHQADEAYRKAQLYVKDQDFSKARREFIKSRISAEKAENSARLIRQKSGEVL